MNDRALGKAAQAGGVVPLSKKIRKQGFTFTQVLRRGNVAIYEQMKPGWAKPGYEVIIIRVGKGHYLSDQKDSLMERYPTNNEWGKYGWTHTIEEDARTAANNAYREELLKQEGKKVA